MPLVRLINKTLNFDKFIFFEETDLTKVHNEIIKVNTDFSISLDNLSIFIKNIIGTNEYNALQLVINPPDYLRIHGEVTNFNTFIKKTKAKDKFPNSDIDYHLYEIGLDLEFDSRKPSNSIGNIEIKYADQNYIDTHQGKMIVLNLHVTNIPEFNNTKKSLDAFTKSLNAFLEIPKAEIVKLEMMNVSNFNTDEYKVVQASEETFNKVIPLINLKNDYNFKINSLEEKIREQGEKIKNFETISFNLNQFFAVKKRFVSEEDSNKLTMEITSEDLEELKQKIPSCKIQ